MTSTTDLPPVEGGFEAPTNAPRETVDAGAIQGVTPGADAAINRAKSPRQAAEASSGEAVKITPTRLREVGYQLELAAKHREKARELLGAMTVGKSGAVVENLKTQDEAMRLGSFDDARGALLALADDLAAL